MVYQGGTLWEEGELIRQLSSVYTHNLHCCTSKHVYAGLQESLEGYEGRREMIVCQPRHSNTRTQKPGAVPGKHPIKTGTTGLYNR